LPLVFNPTKPRGYLTTRQELIRIRQKANQGIEPYRSGVDEVLSFAVKKWDYELKANTRCNSSDSPSWIDNEEGAPRLYARALAYHLTGDNQYAEEAREILQRIMTEVKTISLDHTQCQLNFGWGTPELVAAADLIEDYWSTQTCTGPTSTLYTDTTIGSGNCKVLFQNWLVKNPYYIVSYAAENSKSNWGAAATNATAYIADYLWDRPEVRLIHRSPPQVNDGEDTARTPSEAYAYANQLMFDRMNGYGVEYGSSKSCDYLSGPQYNGLYQNYPQIHLGNNIQQCELMLRRGDRSCFDNVNLTDIPDYTFVDPKGATGTTHLYPGRGSVERAIKAIIVDSNTKWKHDSALEVAYRYYYNYHTLPGFEYWFQHLDRPTGPSQDISFGTLTHGFAAGEMPGLPPVVPPPQPTAP
jgi:hypothetical protein